MSDRWPSHPLSDASSFELRRPVLDAVTSLSGRWRVAPNGKDIEIDLPLSMYSPHERAVIEFAINPRVTAENIFGGLDAPVRRELAKAIGGFFGAGGPGDR